MNMPPSQLGKVLPRPGRRLAIKQLLDLQQLVYDTAFSEGTKAADKAQLSKAWVVLEEQKRILRGKLKPGSINGQLPKELPLKLARQRNRIVDVEAVVAQLKRQELAEASAD